MGQDDFKREIAAHSLFAGLVEKKIAAKAFGEEISHAAFIARVQNGFMSAWETKYSQRHQF